MASLFEKLQAQSACFHKSQQFLLLDEYKKPEVQTDPLGSRALLIPF